MSVNGKLEAIIYAAERTRQLGSNHLGSEGSRTPRATARARADAERDSTPEPTPADPKAEKAEVKAKLRAILDEMITEYAAEWTRRGNSPSRRRVPHVYQAGAS